MKSDRRDSENHEARVKASPDTHVIRSEVVVSNKDEKCKSTHQQTRETMDMDREWSENRDLQVAGYVDPTTG